MPFLRAGLKNRPKPEPEEPKQEDIAVVESVTESVPDVVGGEPVTESVPDVPDGEFVTESVPDVPDGEPITESVPDVAGGEPVTESVPAVPGGESVTESVPDVADGESITENELVPDTSDLPKEILEAVGETKAPESDSHQESESPSGQDSQDNSSSTTTDYSGENLKYDFTSGERYVDKVSTKTEFDKMLDELANISKDLLSWQVEKFAKQHTGKFQGDFDKAESDAKKYEAFLGGYITNAAMTLYDNGYRDAAIKQLEQAKSILEARKKLEEETEATRTRVAENDDVVDLTDILGLFGD